MQDMLQPIKDTLTVMAAAVEHSPNEDDDAAEGRPLQQLHPAIQDMHKSIKALIAEIKSSNSSVGGRKRGRDDSAGDQRGDLAQSLKELKDELKELSKKVGKAVPTSSPAMGTLRTKLEELQATVETHLQGQAEQHLQVSMEALRRHQAEQQQQAA
jgi:hypothetical protein